MIALGLTGSMAMGKSTATNMLQQMDGVAVLCSDDVVKKLYDRFEVIDLIKTTFLETYDKKSGHIDRRKLIGELGTDHEKWDELEKILHPFVLEEQQKFLKEQRTLGTKIAVLDIPLLFETGGEKKVDYTVCITAPEFMQRLRIEQRIAAGKLSEEDAAFRLSRQMGDAEKRKRADFTIQSGQGIAYTQRELDSLIRDIKDKHFGKSHERRRFPPLAL